MSGMYVVTGAGPVGWTVAQHLAEQGQRARVLTRSGSGPEHPLVEHIAGDAKDPRQLSAVLTGATAVFHCIHGSAYRASVWRAELPAAEQAVLAAAEEAGAVVVFPESRAFVHLRTGFGKDHDATAETPAAWNNVWHTPTLPALTQRQLAQALPGLPAARCRPGSGSFRAGR